MIQHNICRKPSLSNVSSGGGTHTPAKIKQRISILMVLTLLLSCMSLYACGSGDGGNSSDDNNNNTSQATVNSAENSEEDLSDTTSDPVLERVATGLPDTDFEGYNFRIISRSYAANSHWWNCDISVEEETGDPINDAVYTRNKNIEEQYNVKITNIPSDNVSGTVSKAVKSGGDDYDAVVIGLNGGQETLSTQGMLYDLHTLPNVDLTKPWWDQLAIEQLTIDNRLFATSSDLTIRDKDATIILMFSKTLVQNYGLEDIYQLVSSGQWTFDKMLEMMKAVSDDINGDGKVDDEDQIGLLSQIAHARMLFNAAGEYTAKVNSEGVPEITLYSERSVAVSEAIKNMQGNKDYAINADEYGGKYADVWDDLQIPMFSENRALFYHAGMNRVTLLRDMAADFGIIPPPKFNEQQDRYYVCVDAWCTSAVSVPVTVGDPERTGFILEALTAESRYTLLPAYYEINLKTKFARDDESKEMIDLILNSRLYDIGIIYNWGSMGGALENLAKGNNTLATFWEKNEVKAGMSMQKTIDKLNAIE